MFTVLESRKKDDNIITYVFAKDPSILGEDIMEDLDCDYCIKVYVDLKDEKFESACIDTLRSKKLNIKFDAIAHKLMNSNYIRMVVHTNNYKSCIITHDQKNDYFDIDEFFDYTMQSILKDYKAFELNKNRKGSTNICICV